MFSCLAAAGLAAALLAGSTVPADPEPLKTSHTVRMGKDGVPEEIVVVPVPLDASGAPAGPITLPDLGIPGFSLTPVSNSSTSARDPRWRDANWNRHWDQKRRPQHRQVKRAKATGERNRPAKRDRRPEGRTRPHR